MELRCESVLLIRAEGVCSICLFSLNKVKYRGKEKS